MDSSATQHFLMVLDRIRENQMQHGELLRGIASRQEAVLLALAGSSGVSRLEKWLPLLKPIAAAAAQSAIGSLVIAYALKGGDLMTAVEALLKLL
jgi:hypothetical protein